MTTRQPLRAIGLYALTASVLVILLALALQVVRLSLQRPWDTETYWYAAAATLQGLNPYDPAHLSRLAHRPVGMPFLYPPITLLFFMPLTLFPVLTAAEGWAVAKVALVFVLIQIWRRFLPRVHPALLAAAAVFGFNAAVIWDLKTGNIAILEQVLLWAGFAAYAGGRRREFAAWIVAGSLFKLVPVLFLLLLLVPSRTGRRDGRLFLGALAAWAGLVFLPALVGPAWARDYLHPAPAEPPWGTPSPSALGLINMLLGDRATPLLAPPFHALLLLLAYVALLVGLSLPALRRLRREGDAARWVMAGVVLYCLLAPRMMAYSYLAAVAPAFALLAPFTRRVGGAVAVAALVSAQALLAPVFWFDYRSPWWANLPFLLLLGVWLLYAWGGREVEPHPPESPAARPGKVRAPRGGR